MNIFDALEHGNSYFPDKQAILFGGDTITYHDLHERACRLSSALKEVADLQVGDRVAAMEVIKQPRVDAVLA